MGEINWPVTIGLNLFRGFVSGCVLVSFPGGEPPWGILGTIMVMTFIGPPLLYAMRWALMRIAMFIPFGLILQVIVLIVTGVPFIVADVIVWLAATLMPNLIPVRAYNPFSLVAYIIVYRGGVAQDLGFDLPASWRRGA